MCLSDGRADGQTNGRTDGQAVGRTSERTDGQAVGRTSERTDGQADGRTHGRRTDRRMKSRVVAHVLVYRYKGCIYIHKPSYCVTPTFKKQNII